MNPSAIPGNNLLIPVTPSGGASYTPYNQQGNAAIASTEATPTQASSPSAVPPQKGNWFTHLLPTIGSIALPTIADLATGGLATPFDIALAGVGSAAGKAGEDVAQGQSLNPSNLLESAGEGALGQGIGAGASSVLGGIGGKLVGKLGGAVEGRAADAATQAGADAEKAEAQRVADTFGGVKSGQGDVGGALSTVSSLGFDKPTAQDLINVGSATTGSNDKTGVGALNFFKQQALEKAGGEVNLENTVNDLKNTLSSPEIENHLGSLEPVAGSRGQLPVTPNNTASKIVKQVRNLLPGDSLDASGQLTRQLSPQEGVKLLSEVGKQVGATSKVTDAMGTQIPEKVAENDVWKSLYNSVKDSVYNRPEVDAAVQGLHVGPEEESVIDDAIKSNGITDPNQAGLLKQHLTDTLNNATSAQDILSAEKPFVNVSRVGNAASKDINSDVTSARAVRRANSGITPDSVGKSGDLPVESAPTGKGNALMDTLALGAAPVTHGGSLLGMLPHAVQMAKNPEMQEKAYNLLHGSGVSKAISKSLPLALTGASQFITHAGDQQGNPVNLNLGSNGMTPQAPTNPNDLNSLLLQLAVAESANPTTSAAGAQGLGQLLPQIQGANQAQSALGGAETAFQQAGGGQGGILGTLAKLSGHITGNPASQYEAQRQQLIQQLTSLGVPTSAVPDITGNNQSATNQFQTLQNLINAKLSGGSVLGTLPSGG